MANKLSKPEIKAYLLNELIRIIEHYGEAGELHGTLSTEELQEIAKLKRLFSARLGAVDYSAENKAWNKLDSRLTSPKY